MTNKEYVKFQNEIIKQYNRNTSVQLKYRDGWKDACLHLQDCFRMLWNKNLLSHEYMTENEYSYIQRMIMQQYELNKSKMTERHKNGWKQACLTIKSALHGMKQRKEFQLLGN